MRPIRLAGKVRALIGVIALGSLTGLGWYVWWKRGEKDRIIAEQKRVIVELERKLDRAWTQELVADVRVDGVKRDPSSGRSTIDLTFVQYEPGTEDPSFRKKLTLEGEEFYIDALVVSFERKFVEAGDGLRGKSLLLFRRAFGDRQSPAQGVSLYRGSGEVAIPEKLQVDRSPGDFERRIWAHFWEIANDPDRARAEGVRVAQGEAPHVRPWPGQVYKLTLRAAGGLELTPRLPAALVRDPGPSVVDVVLELLARGAHRVGERRDPGADSLVQTTIEANHRTGDSRNEASP